MAKPCEGSYEYQAVMDGKNPRCFAGRYISVADEKGRVFRIVGMFRDMQDQKDRENRKIAQERSFRLSMNADAVSALDFNAVTGERMVSCRATSVLRGFRKMSRFPGCSASL